MTNKLSCIFKNYFNYAFVFVPNKSNYAFVFVPNKSSLTTERQRGIMDDISTSVKT